MRRGTATRRGMMGQLGRGAALLGTAALTACAGLGGGRGTGGPGGAKQLTGTVDFWSNAGYPYSGRIGEQLVQEFQQANPGLTVAFTDTSYAEFMTKLVTASAAGTPPDLSYADRYVTKSFACLGVNLALDDYMKTAKHAKATAFWPRLQYDTTYGGKTWAVPHGPDVGLLYYNRNSFRESGLDAAKPPATWDEAASAIQRLTKRSGSTLERVGWAPLRGWGVPWMIMYWQLGGELTTPDEKQAAYNNDKAIQVFEWLLKVYEAQGGDQAVTEAFQGASPYDAFIQGRMAMVWATHSQRRTAFEKESSLDFAVTHWPTPPSGQRSNYMGGWSLIVPKGAKNPDGAFHYLDFLSGDDAQIRWSEEFNNVPATRSAGNAPKWVQDRPERKVAQADMALAKWVITAPGGDKALTHQVAVGGNIVSRKLGIREALAESVKLVQEQLDEAQRNCGL
jgi:multiple sugar transport system substrate-binding protein